MHTGQNVKMISTGSDTGLVMFLVASWIALQVLSGPGAMPVEPTVLSSNRKAVCSSLPFYDFLGHAYPSPGSKIIGMANSEPNSGVKSPHFFYRYDRKKVKLLFNSVIPKICRNFCVSSFLGRSFACCYTTLG